MSSSIENKTGFKNFIEVTILSDDLDPDIEAGHHAVGLVHGGAQVVGAGGEQLGQDVGDGGNLDLDIDIFEIIYIVECTFCRYYLDIHLDGLAAAVYAGHQRGGAGLGPIRGEDGGHVTRSRVLIGHSPGPRARGRGRGSLRTWPGGSRHRTGCRGTVRDTVAMIDFFNFDIDTVILCAFILLKLLISSTFTLYLKSDTILQYIYYEILYQI